VSYNVDEHGLDPKAFVEATDPKGKKVKVIPAAPAIILTNPKYAHNLGQTVRAASCFGVTQVWWSGDRVVKELAGLSRIPREERMRGYSDVSILYNERPLDAYSNNVVPVCIELVPGAEDLVQFEHPENAVYVFGPEDGGVDQGTRRRCHRFVKIPTKHCTNLSAAVYLVLYDRHFKRVGHERLGPPTL
jgi:tRNA(Leu) C34 or U34 (ribose-2'-O)-methylase TrmL